MMENDDKLISQFMHANKHEIEDNGFSRRVIRQLPEHAKWMSDVLTTVFQFLVRCHCRSHHFAILQSDEQHKLHFIGNCYGGGHHYRCPTSSQFPINCVLLQSVK